MKNLLGRGSKYFYIWVLIVFLFGLTIMTSYVFVQQDARSGVNIPLLQIMQSVKADLQAGVKPSSILEAKQIDLSSSQSPFITLYGLDKNVIGSSQSLSGRTLTLPTGVLDISRLKGESRVTWQPTNKLRFATITDFVPTLGYVSVSESLREVEDRATKSAWIAVLALGLGSLTSGVGIWWFVWRGFI